MYTVAFVLGFFTSFGWWTATKVQKALDNIPTQLEEVKKGELND